jgi:hypothetical protein
MEHFCMLEVPQYIDLSLDVKKKYVTVWEKQKNDQIVS